MSEVASAYDKFDSLRNLPTELVVDDDTRLRRIMPEDSEAFVEIITANPDISKYVTWASQVNDASDVVPVLQNHSDEDMTGRFAILHQDSVVGYVGIFPGTQDGEYGMGYFIDNSARGKELATKSALTILTVAKLTTSPKKIYLQIDPNNVASVAIATKLGFKPAETVWDNDLKLNEKRYRLELRK